MNDEDILIVGTGALACLFAARLAPHTAITMLGSWTEGIQALNKHGVRLVEEGHETTFPVKATSEPGDCQGIGVAIVLVKSWQTERAASQLKHCLDEKGIALTLQNGYGNLHVLQENLGFERAALGVTTSGATLLGPGRVRPGGQGPIHLLSEVRISPLVQILEAAGFDVEEADDLDGLVWGKLVINAGINPMTALLQIPNGALLEQVDARTLMEAAAKEAAEVAAAMGVRLPYEDPVKRVEEVARGTAKNHSSMYQDVQRGAPTEIDAICGAIVRQGEQAGVPTPVNEVLWHLIKAKVSEKLRGVA